MVMVPAAVRYWAPPACLLLLHALLILTSIAGSSITTDEVAHLPAGYSYIQTGDFRLNRDHPPLMKAWAALPLVTLDLKPIWELPSWSHGEAWGFGAQFLTENRAPLRRIIWMGRLPMVAVGLLLGVVLFAWARTWWGYRPALFVLFLFALCPNFLGHGGLVTTDAGVACFTLLALYALWRFSEHQALSDAAWCGVALGLALLAKYSALVTMAVVAVLCSASFMTRVSGVGCRVWRDRRATPDTRRPTPVSAGTWLAAATLMVVIPLGLITLGFGFPRGLANFADGLAVQRAFDRDRTAFLWGQYSDRFWYYFVLAQWWKTPVPTLLCFAAALVLARWRTPIERLRWAFILLPIAAFHLAGMAFPFKVGVRYMLPTLPFVFLACGAVAARVGRAGRGWRIAFAGLCLWYAAGTLRAWPNYLSYFNQLAGGVDGGVHYLDDSNIEWGQDLYRLRDYLDTHPPTTLHAAVVAKIGLEHYGIDAEWIGLRDLTWPEPGVTYVVGAHFLQRPSLYPGNPAVRFHWLDRYRPVDRIGGSLFVYRFSIDPADVGRADVEYIDRNRWFDDAAETLREIVARSPDFAEARQLLRRIETER
jgi:hypothetical protein